MNTVTVGGVTYTKLSVLAKQYDYTTDYIGQLCRAGKIEAELVGRAWYANELSLQNYKATRYQDSGVDEKTGTTRENTPKKATSNHIPVKPRLSKRTHRHLDDKTARQRQEEHFLHIAYVADEAELAPRLQKDAQSISSSTSSVRRTITPRVPNTPPATPAESHTVPIRRSDVADSDDNTITTDESVSLEVAQNSNSYDLSFTDIPSVSLRGSVKIQDLEAEDYVHSQTPAEPKAPRVTPKLPPQTQLPVQKAKKQQKSHSSAHLKHMAEPQPAPTAPKMTFSPASITPPPSGTSFTIVLTGFLFALMGAGLLLFTGSTYVVEGQTVASSWNLQLASLRELLAFWGTR